MGLFSWGRSAGGGRGGEYNFDDSVRRTLALARENALALRHNYVDVFHHLMALVSEEIPLSRGLLERMGVDPDELGRLVRERVKPGRALSHPDRPLPYTSGAKKTLELAMDEARRFGHDSVSAKHLLAGLVRHEKSHTSQLLAEVGVRLDALRQAAGWTPDTGDGAAGFRVAIDDASDRSIYEQVVAQVEEAVATGRLRPGDRLLPVRRLADELDIAPGTVARAYGELERRGVVVTEGARGTRVADRAGAASRGSASMEALAGLLRPVAVHAFHLGASAEELRAALEKGMEGIFKAE